MFCLPDPLCLDSEHFVTVDCDYKLAARVMGRAKMVFGRASFPVLRLGVPCLCG